MHNQSVGLRIIVAECSGLKGFGSCSFWVGCRVRPSDWRTVKREVSCGSPVGTPFASRGWMKHRLGWTEWNDSGVAVSAREGVVTEYIVGALGKLNARAVVGVPGRSWGGRSRGTAVFGPCKSADASDDDRFKMTAWGGRGKPPMVALEIWLYALCDESEVAIEPTEPFRARGSTA